MWCRGIASSAVRAKMGGGARKWESPSMGVYIEEAARNRGRWGVTLEWGLREGEVLARKMREEGKRVKSREAWLKNRGKEAKLTYNEIVLGGLEGGARRGLKAPYPD